MFTGPQRLEDINRYFNRLNENDARVYTIQGDLGDVHASEKNFLELPTAALKFNHQPKIHFVAKDVDCSQVKDKLGPYGRALWKKIHRYSPLTKDANGAVVYRYVSLGPKENIDSKSDIFDFVYIGSSIKEEHRDDRHDELWAKNSCMIDLTGQMSVGAAINVNLFFT
uniref:Uncharacterized protein n=1 Tax=Panagrolaimus davidi TaxID=227884 RepID=A0A914PXJ5_9BILA